MKNGSKFLRLMAVMLLLCSSLAVVALNKTDSVEVTFTNVIGELYVDGEYTLYNFHGREFVLKSLPGKTHQIKVLRPNRYFPYEQTLTVGENDEFYRVKYDKKYLRKDEVYVELGGALNPKSGFVGAAGVNLDKFNAEISYVISSFEDGCYMLKGNTDNINTSTIFTTDWFDVSVDAMIGAKVGRNFKVGNRYKLTPQIGVRYLLVDVEGLSTYHVNATIGGRAFMAFTDHIGASISAAYCASLFSGDIFKNICDASSDFDGLCNGFDLRLSLVFNF